MKSSVPMCLLIILAFALFTKVQSTAVSSCSDNSPLPEVEIQNCDQQPCVMYFNGTSAITMKFTSPRKLEHISSQALLAILGTQMEYPLSQSDACDGIVNTQCPLEKGQVVEYSCDFYVFENFPVTRFSMEFSLLDQDQEGQRVECFKVDVQFKSQV